MGKKNVYKKIKLMKIHKIKQSPRWADIRKFGMKRARRRRIQIAVKRWRRTRIKV
ncbi:MAG: hypothetical protein QW818_00515 [Candidatus Aenigmatarchaeota archaeon]|nr:hypothetical protein [Candidatus Aenigmarchaeota archaeon]